jgi:hypothetical protein
VARRVQHVVDAIHDREAAGVLVTDRPVAFSQYTGSDSAEKPPSTTEWIAPIRAQACIATTPSTNIGMQMTTRSAFWIPSTVAPFAKRLTLGSWCLSLTCETLPSSASENRDRPLAGRMS